MPSLGPQELFIILIIVVLLVGSTQLPKLGKAIGEFTREFKSGIKDIDSKNINQSDEEKPKDKN